MKEIPLTKGQVALVDDDRFDELSQYRWAAKLIDSQSPGLGYYAYRNVCDVTPDGKRKNRHIYMHKIILGLETSNMKGDHLNGNGLDNQINNLRAASNQQNSFNKKKTKRPTSSKYKGVSFNKRNKTNPWVMSICKTENGKRSTYHRHFSDEVDAAVEYDKKALELFGEFASLNFPEVQDGASNRLGTIQDSSNQSSGA